MLANNITTLIVPYGVSWTGNEIEFSAAHPGVTLALAGTATDPVALNIVKTNPGKVIGVDLTRLTGMVAAPTIDHVTDLSANVVSIDLTGTGVNNITNIVPNSGNTTITVSDGTTVPK